MRVPLAPRTVDDEAAFVQVDKCLGQRQAQAGALIAALQPVIHLGEGLEGDLDIFRVHADAGIAHRHGDGVGLFDDTE